MNQNTILLILLVMAAYTNLFITIRRNKKW